MKTKVYIKDHLGSNRVVVNTIGYIYQNNIYYALGGTTALSSGQEYQQFKYTDKEYDPMHGLNQYDFGARQYDQPSAGTYTHGHQLSSPVYFGIKSGNQITRVGIDHRRVGDVVQNGFHYLTNYPTYMVSTSVPSLYYHSGGYKPNTLY